MSAAASFSPLSRKMLDRRRGEKIEMAKKELSANLVFFLIFLA
jgi:hypothetical protein